MYRYIRQLRDVLMGNGPQDGDTLVFDSALNKWVPQAAGNGGSSSVLSEWCRLDIGSLPALNADNSWYYQLVPGDLILSAQSGSDFSLGTAESDGTAALLSAAGGWFQIITYQEIPSGVTLDSGKTTSRYASVGTGSTHNANNPFYGFGLDTLIPVSEDGDVEGNGGVPLGPPPVYVVPGGEVLRTVQTFLIGATGTDEITNFNLVGIAVWKLAAA